MLYIFLVKKVFIRFYQLLLKFHKFSLIPLSKHSNVVFDTAVSRVRNRKRRPVRVERDYSASSPRNYLRGRPSWPPSLDQSNHESPSALEFAELRDLRRASVVGRGKENSAAFPTPFNQECATSKPEFLNDACSRKNYEWPYYCKLAARCTAARYVAI